MFGCLDVWMFGCLDVWMFGCLDVWMFGCLDLWIFGWRAAARRNPSGSSRRTQETQRTFSLGPAADCSACGRSLGVCWLATAWDLWMLGSVPKVATHPNIQ